MENQETHGVITLSFQFRVIPLLLQYTKWFHYTTAVWGIVPWKKELFKLPYSSHANENGRLDWGYKRFSLLNQLDYPSFYVKYIVELTERDFKNNQNFFYSGLVRFVTRN